LVNEIDFTQPGWAHRQLRPTTVDELARVVAESTTVCTYQSLQNEFSLDPLARQVIRRDHLRTGLPIFAEPVEDDSDPSAPWQAEAAEKMSNELARLDALLEGRNCPSVTHLSLCHLATEIDHKVEDQVVIVRGPVLWMSLNAKLSQHGQCIPHASLIKDTPLVHSVVAGEGPIGALDINLPHALEAQCGSYRDWVLGLKIVLADGTIVKCGSQAVKNVAGYDVQKLLIGARGTLGIVVEVTLRTYPLAALPKPELETGPRAIFTEDIGKPSVKMPQRWHWIQRTLPSDFRAAIRSAGSNLMVADHASSTLWAIVPPEESLDRFPGDWVIRSGCGERNLQFTDPTQIRFMRRAKDLFDPTHKLNPGEMGFF
jgi:glycolate oxidase FAD binding subunit